MIPIQALIIEDSEDAVALLVEQLRLGGFEPSFERVDSAEALAAALERKTWDILLSDHGGGTFSSFDALEVVRQRGLDVPFIVVSANLDEEVQKAVIQAGAKAFIPKGQTAQLIPIVRRELRERILREERRQTVEFARQNEFRFRLFYELAPIAYQCLDLKANVVDVNPAWLRLLGFRRDEVIGKAFSDFLAPEQVERFASAYTELLATGGANRVGYELRGKNERRLKITASSRVAYDEQGHTQVTYWILDCLGQPLTTEPEPREPETRAVPGATLSAAHLLAICVFCKKIRDTHGGWDPLEDYFGEHFHLQFSHGFCPECARKFFPEIFP